jgi:aryl-alcohol dehydrogenase-like predicted oxidoreductase
LFLINHFLLSYHLDTIIFTRWASAEQVSKLGFGCVGLSGAYNAPLSHEAGCLVIKEAFDRGVTFFDTSDFYGHNHDNEIMVGKVIFFIFTL